MEQKIFNYPSYQPNQFLTSQDLNNSFSYLEEQERLTRANLIGTGIVCGLDFSIVSDAGSKLTAITIHAGFGVTADGYSVDLPKPLEYKYMVKLAEYKEDKDISGSEKKLFNSISGVKFLLFTEEEYKSKKFIYDATIMKPLNITQADYSKFCLAIVVDVKEEKVYNCNPSDCNIKSSYKDIIFRPVLLESSSLNKINSFYTELDYLKIQKLAHISSIRNTSDFYAKIKSVFETNRSIIYEFLDSTIRKADELLASESAQLVKALKVFNKITAGEPEQYYLLFQNDLQAAINEFIQAYNNFINKYHFTSPGRKDLLLILGSIPFIQNDPYRYIYTEIEKEGQQIAEKHILSELYLRIASLMSQFMNTKKLASVLAELNQIEYVFSRKVFETIKFNFDVNKTTTIIKNASKYIKLIPCKGYTDKLGNRSIPYYYDITGLRRANPLASRWHAHDLDDSLDLVYNYYWYELSKAENYDTEMLLNLEDYPFYRIEGHQGVSIDAAYKFLFDLIQTLDIPVQLMKIDITNQLWIGFKDSFEAFTKNYKEFAGEVYLEIQKKENAKAYEGISGKIQGISQDLLTTSYRDSDTVTKLLNDVNSYCNMIIAPDFNPATSKTKSSLDTAFIKEIITNYDLFSKRDMLHKQYSGIEMIRESVLSQMKGLEHIGGVYKGGTFILVHDGKKVIGDFALPYFYNIDRERLN
jgi:hypothetical protein